jgi:hypothetical protein
MLPWVVVDLAVKLAVVGLSLYPLARPGASHFEGKAMGARALAYPAAMVLIPVAWLAAGRPSPYPVVADVLIGIPFLVDTLGNVFNLFAIERFDMVPHFVGWLCLAMAFGLAVDPLLDVRWVGFGLALGFGAVLDVLWEIAEFLFSRLGASGLQLTYENTIQDLAMSLSGAATGALLGATVLWPAAGTPASLFGWS